MTALAFRQQTPTPVGIASHLAFHQYTDAHRPFVFGTFFESLRSLRLPAGEREDYEHALKRAIRDPGTSAIVVSPTGEDGEYMGWAAATPTCLLYAYVRFPYRRGKIGVNLGSALIEMATGHRDTATAIWTLDASRMAAHGYPIRYDLDAHQAFKQLSR